MYKEMALSALLNPGEFNESTKEIHSMLRGNTKIDEIIIDLEANKIMDRAFDILMEYHRTNYRAFWS